MAGPTLHDVARRAHVSKSTVSLVINGSARVHPATAARVWDVVSELNYVPNRVARSLKSGRSHLLGVMVSDITNPYFAELVRCVITAAKGDGYDVFMLDTDYDPGQLEQHLEHLREYRPDGLILLTTERSETAVLRLQALGLPAVLLNWAMGGRRISEVAVDYEPGMAQLVAHLIELGHRRLAFVGGPPAFHSANARERAFRSVVATQDGWLAPPLVLSDDFRLQSDAGARVVERLRDLPAPERPTAVVVANDLVAISILRTLQAEGWDVPGAISVAGIDDIALAAYVRPALTTLRLPRRQMGDLAFRLLKQMIDNPELTAEPAVVTPRLILRESVGAAPA